MRLLLLCLILTPLAFSAQEEDSAFYRRAKEFGYRFYDTRLCFCEEKKDSITKSSTPNKFTNKPLFKTIEEIPDSLLYLLPDSTRTQQENKRKITL